MKIDRDKLDQNFPTQFQSSDFWEALGRAVATFGFLEDTLARAHFALLSSQTSEIGFRESEVLSFIHKLEKSLSYTLTALIDKFEDAVRVRDDLNFDNFDQLISKLRKAAVLRNAICHGLWRARDDQGRSELRYFDRTRGQFADRIDVDFLRTVHRETAQLTIDVMETVTSNGYSFPGSNSPGKPIS